MNKIKVHFESNFNPDFIAKNVSVINKNYLVSSGGYNQINENLLNTKSYIYKNDIDVLFLIIDNEFLNFDFFGKIKPRKNQIISTYKRFEKLIKYCLKNSGTNIFISFIPLNATEKNNSLYENMELYNENIYYEKFKHFLFTIFENNYRVNFCDLSKIFFKYGSDIILDNRLKYITKSPFSKKGVELISKQINSYIKILFTPRKKLIVVDLDNTLWGGVIGEELFENIKLSNTGEGKAYYDFQNKLKELHNMGFLIAAVSKNNESDVKKFIKKHPFQIIKIEDFVTYRINWKNKDENIISIIEELKIGENSLVFIDDNPFEINLIKKNIPKIDCIQVPDNISDLIEIIESKEYFWKLNITKEDEKRNLSYKSNSKRNTLKNKSGSFNEYLKSLKIKIKIRESNINELERLQDMILKTNQFNLNLNRFSKKVITTYINSNKKIIFSIEVKDIYYNYGIVGIVQISISSKKAYIDNFILSCRVIGREIEHKILSKIITILKNKNINSITGVFVKGPKNMQTEMFYKKNNFLLEKKYDSRIIFIKKINE